ncbi:hypothetical protein DAPPUDRAFT_274778, partial [Daphnia pulex]
MPRWVESGWVFFPFSPNFGPGFHGPGHSPTLADNIYSTNKAHFNCGVVLLLVVVLKYYTTEASKYYTTIYAAATCIAKEPEYYITHPQQRPNSMSFTLEGRGDHYVGSTTGLLTSSGHGGDQDTAAKEYYTTPPPYYATKSTYATSTYNTDAPQPQAYNTTAAPSYYVELKYYTKAAVNYTKTYATPSYYNEAPNYYTEEATCYTSTYSAPVYYTEEPKYYSAPSYYQTEAPVCYTKATEYYTTIKR